MLFLKDVQNQCEGLDLDLLERNARLAIHEAGYPLSATLYRMHSYTDRILSGREWKKKRIVSLTFSYSDEAPRRRYTCIWTAEREKSIKSSHETQKAVRPSRGGQPIWLNAQGTE